MNLLIDTHILIWYIAGNPRLKPAMTDLLEAAVNWRRFTLFQPVTAIP
jgi:PIN domain nuclease of toxin-antitoxin system